MKTKVWERVICGFIAMTIFILNISILDFKSLMTTLAVVNNNIKISGTIAFNDTIDGIDWSSLVRPNEFNQKIVVIQKYYKDGVEYQLENVTQDDMSDGNFYLKFVHDGEGSGNFTIENVPTTVTIDNTKYNVSGYIVKVQTDLPYYENNGSEFDIEDIDSQSNLELTMDLKTMPLILKPEVIPENQLEEPSFKMNVTFTNPNTSDISAENGQIKSSYLPTANTPTTIQVPVGIGYSVNQIPTEGYKFDGKYILNNDTILDNVVQGIISETSPTTIVTKNYNQNASVVFEVIWIDNNSKKRPSITDETFSLQYKIDGNDWITITNDNYTDLGIDKLPVFNVSSTNSSIFSFSGLPVQLDDKVIEYQIVVNSVPDGYTYSQDVNTENKKQIITFTEQTDFSAVIQWNDNAKAENRPSSIENLKIYRTVDHAKYELIQTDINIEKNENIWNISVPNLPKYDLSNHEYDYVLIQGNIDDNGNVNNEQISEQYVAHYDNGSGNYGNDNILCHNNGKIIEVLVGNKDDFQATVKWLDSEDDIRPNSTVTLWRYVQTDETTIDIDTAYNDGKVTQVIFQKNVDDKEMDEIISYSLQSIDGDIIFNYTTVDGLSENYKLPAYDDHGNEYVYFVREALTGENAQNYEIKYQDTEGVHKNGTLANGTITNVRREKVAVSIKKVWDNPSGLADIDGSKVQLQICVDDTPLKVYSSEVHSYEILEGDELTEVQTANGFSSNNPTSEITYYVNIYDDNGKPLDMSKASINEIFINAGGEQILPIDGVLNINGNSYEVTTSLDKSLIDDGSENDYITLGDGTKEYCYIQRNKFVAYKEYQLIKKWDTSIDSSQYEDIQCVVMQLFRCSSKDLIEGNSKYVDVGKYEIEKQSGTEWSTIIDNLLKYDNDGYEYYYRANEVGFKKSDGTYISIGERGWSHDYFRTTDRTTVINYITTSGTGGGYFTISKTWLDNGNKYPVKIRVYEKSKLQESLSNLNLNENDIIELNQLSNEYKQYDLNEGNQYASLFYYPKGYSWKDYIVLEYSIIGSDNAETIAKYTYGALSSALNSSGGYNYSGIVENETSKYNVSIYADGSNGDCYIINTRTGETKISVNKQWYDDNNATKNRPDVITFKLYRDGNEYTNISAPFSITSSGANVSLDTESGIVTVSSNGDSSNNWSFTIDNLPMFSSSGVLYHYDVEEKSTNVTSTDISYIMKKVSTVDGENKTQNYTFNFENTIKGTTKHIAYKYWKDVSVNPSNRPDIYFSLYRYLRKDGNKNQEPYNDYKNQIWTAGTSADSYNWKITIEDLPRFDEYGNEYVYVFREKMNNNGKTVYGTYIESNRTITEEDGSTYEEFINVISNKMTVSGKKTWTGLVGYQTGIEDLPNPDIYLYRIKESSVNSIIDSNTNVSSKNDIYNLSDDEFNQYIGTEIEYITKTTLDLQTKTKYSFNNQQFDVFDENGERYFYFVREVFTNEDNIVNQLYIKTNSNGTLKNQFRNDINRRKITVTKTWGGRDNLSNPEDKYPSVTYTLWRYELNSNNQETKLTKIDTKKINSNQFTGEDGTAHVTFDNLLIFSPNGKRYYYYVTENSIAGYTIHYYNDNGIENNNNKCDIISFPNLYDTDNTTEVKTMNVYDKKGLVQLSGDKVWNDFNDYESLRPDINQFEVTLRRHTKNEYGQQNAVDLEEVPLVRKENIDISCTVPYIVWTQEDSIWKYTIYNLERYAPNGMSYIYILSENQVSGYKKAPDIQKALSNDNSENVQMTQMTNQFDGSYTVRKNWMDGYNKYNLRPKNITIKLQRSIDGQNWNDMKWVTAMEGKLPCELEENGVKIVSVKLDSDNVIKNTKNSSWQYTFSNLPTVDKDGNTYKYKCVEVKIGDVYIKKDNSGEKEFAGAYECQYTTINDDKTVIENTLDSTSLVVTKNWQGDEDNLYSSRPESVEFILQKMGSNSNINLGESDITLSESDNDFTQWEDVILSNGKPYTFTISKKDGWTKTLEDLPVVEVITNKDGTTYTSYNLYFRAVEVHKQNKDETETKLVKGAENYIDITEEKNHYFDKDLLHNVSNITNELIRDEEKSTITVNKQWYREDGADVTSTFELLYKKTDETDWHHYDTKLTHDLTCTTTDNQTFTWKNLPKFDREGNQLEYNVIEYDINGYKTEVSTNDIKTEYSFTNIECQDYTVEKIWQNTDYSHNINGKFTAEFILQQNIEGTNEWTIADIENPEQTLISTKENDTKTYTWNNLPKYTLDGKKITYRAVETKINGNPITDNTDGNYIVTYNYDSGNEPNFSGKKTTATNRMIYGFINFSKQLAYLLPEVTPSNVKLKDVVFDIFTNDNDITPYIEGITTDDYGNIIQNSDGTYGTNHRYLITGTYTLKERLNTNTVYSAWEDGIEFEIGLDTTGEHGTAWIYTQTLDNNKEIQLECRYIKSSNNEHHYSDLCEPSKNDSNSLLNIESRGIIEFTKTDENNNPVDTNTHSQGETQAYFGVYIDETCTNQVAGMIPSTNDNSQFILTNLDKDGNIILNRFNSLGISYLRNYGDSGFSLLSGTYYIKEIVPPTGYKLDNTIRVAKIDHVGFISTNLNLEDTYKNNKAKIGISINDITMDYHWSNVKNKVTLYKLDQYGRKVTLNNNGYLELKVDNAKFPTGEKVIYLYQNSENPAKKTDGTTIGKYIIYDESTQSWTIEGLFDINLNYTLIEPSSSVPEKNIIADSIEFGINSNGEIQVLSTDIFPKDNPLDAQGDDYKNYYKSDTNENIIVMRDVARYLKNVILEKINSVTAEKIPNISFKLYKYSSMNDDETLVEVKPVIEDDIFLTTDENGIINLENQDIINLITGKSLSYGLDVGKYYFEEVERGASDQYRLLDKIYFEIIPNKNPTNPQDYQDYSIVTFITNEYVEQTSNNTGRVKNDPVTKQSKTLEIKKIDIDNKNLEGAEFELNYKSINNGQIGAVTPETYHCRTGSDGILYLIEDGNMTNQKPDISKKGTYTLRETKAPDTYMTPTQNDQVITMMTFEVTSQNEIKVISSNNLVTYNITDDNSLLDVSVLNEKTVVNISKLNDIINGTKSSNQKNMNGEPLRGAELEIYEDNNTTPVFTLNDENVNEDGTTWTIIGKLKENTIYKLHEKNPPIGYMKANDIYFKLFGTVINNDIKQSVLYVWNGSGSPSLVIDNGWNKETNLKNNVLTMVDETIIAPLDLQKVIGDQSTGYNNLKGATFDIKAEDLTLGTAISNENGHLVWKSITERGYSSNLIFDLSGNRITSGNSVIGKSIILQQNASGYTFTETHSPDNAYNSGDTLTVKITAENYVEYKSNQDLYIDINLANKSETKTVSLLTERDNQANENDFINPPYKSTVTLHKYDLDEEAQKDAIAGTEFTLYRGSISEENIYKKAYSNDVLNSSGVFIIDNDGNISITIKEKGTYILKETKSSTGYILDDTNSFEFTLQDKASTDDNNNNIFGYNQTNELKKDINGVPNERQKGTIIFTKTDKTSQEPLNGVVYILKRTDIPKNSNLTDYLLKTPVKVITGNNYTTTKDETGTWKLIQSKGEDGTIKIMGLNWGKYTLKETTELSGYIINSNEHEFTINQENVETELNLSDANIKNTVTFYKTNSLDSNISDLSTHKPLKGAVFEVHSGNSHPEGCEKLTFNSSGDYDVDGNPTITTNDDGSVTIHGLPTDNTNPDINAVKTYHLIETVAPKGYKLQRVPVVFTVDRMGNIKVNETTVEKVTMENEAIKIYIQKLDMNGNPLSGATFTLTDICESDCNHTLANGETMETIVIPDDDADGKIMIPIERIIGGHTYELKEIKAPDGYESTAIVTFKVNVDGTISELTSTGGYVSESDELCASLDTDKTTISIKNQIIGVTLKKVDSADSKPLNGVTFKITPYGESSFKGSMTEYSSITNDDGTLTISDGILKHDNQYLLQEITTLKGYYINKEVQDGVILNVDKNGDITITRLPEYDNKNIDGKNSCPIMVSDGNIKGSDLLAKNTKSTTFELTKKVEGNMGDINGEFKIKMELFEPDGTPITDRTVNLKYGETYNSETSEKSFGNDAIPVGATLVITEDNELDYSAIAYITKKDGTTETIKSQKNADGKSTLTITLNSNEKISIELVNIKDVTIDIGVDIKKQAPLILISITILMAWLYIRFRKKSKERGIL